MPSTRALILLALVLFAFWRPLFAGGTLAPDDQLWLSDPFNASAPDGLTIEVAERDAATIHGWWAGWADDVRSGDLGWWRDVGAGEPFLAEGLPLTHLTYLVVPEWYAPGLVAALTVLLAAFGAMRLSDRRGLTPMAGLFAGIVFGFSGLMFAWIGWPHATALALAPWVIGALLRAGEEPGARPAIAAALALAAQLWCGVFAISAFTVLGAGCWLAIDAIRRRQPVGLARASAAVVLGGLGAAPHLWPRWERWSWADTTHLEAVGDTSAPLRTVITTLFGSGFGNESVGVQWFETSSFQLSVAFVGAAVVIAAVVAGVAGRIGAGVIGLGVLGFGIAYVGGPFDVLADLIAGDTSLASHARVLWVLGLGLAGAHGIDAISDPSTPGTLRGRIARRSVRVGAAVGGLVAVVAVVAWIDFLRDAQGLRAVGAQAFATVVVIGVVVALLVAWARGRLTGTGVASAMVVLVAYELLAFGMPLPTVTDRAERPTATAAHEALDALVGEHGRIAGDHDAFAPADSARFGFADVRAPGLRSTAEIAAFTSVDPGSVLAAVGGGPFEPIVRVRGDADPSRSHVWDLLGVDAWVLPRDTAPPGRRVDPRPTGRTALAAVSPLGEITIPDGGLRAVVLDLRVPAFTAVAVEIGAGADVVTSSVVLRRPVDGPVAIPVAAEGLPGGAAGRVVVAIDAGDAEAEAGTIDGRLALGTIEGEGADELVWTDGALIIARPTPRAVWEGPGDATITVERETADRLELEVDAAAAGLLRSDLVAEPGWVVEVDGDGASVVSIEDLVLGVELPEGTHRVVFEYRPPRLRSGVLLALLGFAIGIVWVSAQSRRASRAG